MIRLQTIMAVFFCIATVLGEANLPGLDALQTNHARTIAKKAHDHELPVRGCEVAIATAIVESQIRVLANKRLPESFNYPHDGVGEDHDSVGIFQQRPQFWGTVQDCMDPNTSADKFFNALKAIDNWEDVTIGTAAQAVQKSAFPERYDQHAEEAQAICAAAF